jgi:hypothetical protein
MELPDDVVSIIRAYSKPSFVWHKEFNEARSLNLSTDHFQKLRKKMGDPIVREQLKICVKAYDALNERESKKNWWLCVSMEELYALLNDQDCEMNYAEWYFNDAWMDSDDGTVES